MVAWHALFVCLFVLFRFICVLIYLHFLFPRFRKERVDGREQREHNRTAVAVNLTPDHINPEGKLHGYVFEYVPSDVVWRGFSKDTNCRQNPRRLQ